MSLTVRQRSGAQACSRNQVTGTRWLVGSSSGSTPRKGRMWRGKLAISPAFGQRDFWLSAVRRATGVPKAPNPLLLSRRLEFGTGRPGRECIGGAEHPAEPDGEPHLL